MDNIVRVIEYVIGIEAQNALRPSTKIYAIRTNLRFTGKYFITDMCGSCHFRARLIYWLKNKDCEDINASLT